MNRNNLLDEHPPRSVVVVRALRLGDLLCAVPALRALRAALPGARITLLGLPLALNFVERYARYLDGFLDFPGFPGLPEQAPGIRHLPAFLASVQQAHFDLAIQMHGSGLVSNPLTMLLGARVNAGFFQPGQYCPDVARFLPYPSDEPELRRHLKLMGFLGFPPKGEDMEFPLYSEDLQSVASVDPQGVLVPGGYICIHPGARATARRWSARRFAAVADRLARQGLHVAVTGGADESDLTAAVARMMKAPSLDLGGRTNIGTLAAVLAGARLLICNDTGVSHMASALHVPSVVIFTASDPMRWAPLDKQRHRVVRQPAVCSPCEYPTCPRDHRCASSVTVKSVLIEAEKLLRREYDCAA